MASPAPDTYEAVARSFYGKTWDELSPTEVELAKLFIVPGKDDEPLAQSV